MSADEKLTWVREAIDHGYEVANWSPDKFPVKGEDARAMALAAYYASSRTLVESARAAGALASALGVTDSELDLVDELVRGESVEE